MIPFSIVFIFIISLYVTVKITGIMPAGKRRAKVESGNKEEVKVAKKARRGDIFLLVNQLNFILSYHQMHKHI